MDIVSYSERKLTLEMMLRAKTNMFLFLLFVVFQFVTLLHGEYKFLPHHELFMRNILRHRSVLAVSKLLRSIIDSIT